MNLPLMMILVLSKHVALYKNTYCFIIENICVDCISLVICWTVVIFFYMFICFCCLFNDAVRN
jgi:hypothetical protein